MNEETIYMGNLSSENNNHSEEKNNIMAKAWKPVTIGGITGIVLGAGAMLASKAYASTDKDDAGADETPVQESKPITTQEVVETEPEASATELNVATIADDMSFEEAFATARDLVGPGGVFYWRGVIFSTYTVDEWNAMTDEEHELFAIQVRPEVDANSIDMTDVEPDQIYPVNDEDMALAEAIDEVEDEMVETDEDVAIAEVQNDELLADIALPDMDVPDADIAMAHINADMQDAMGLIEDLREIPEMDEDVAMAEEDNLEADEDVAIADADVQEPINDLAFAEMVTKQPVNDMMDSQFDVVAQDESQQEDDDDNVVRIIGYGESDGHMVMGLDMDGDNSADILVIDVDDSGSYAEPDIVVDSEGNVSTYDELVDIAQDQQPDDSTNPMDEMQSNHPDMGQDMPDYMDDAIPHF